MFPIGNQDDEDELLNDPPIFDGTDEGEEEEEINALNQGQNQRFDDYLLNGEDEEEFDEDEMQFEYMEADFGSIDDSMNQFDDGILVNQDLYNAHYMNLDQEFLMEKPEDFLFNTLENPMNIAPISRESRLALYPEMHMLPPLRRLGKPVTNSKKTTEQKLAKYTPAAADLLRAINFYPDDGSFPKPEKQSSHLSATVKIEGFAALIKKNLKSTIGKKQKPPSFRKPFRPPPPPGDPYSKFDHSSNLPLTPLPDRFYKRRVTIDAEQAGFMSECVQCPICSFMFRNSALLLTHMEKHRSTGQKEVVSQTSGLICPFANCNLRSDTIATVVKHMKMAHGIVELPFERIVFKSIGEFKMWKAELERLTMSRFSRASGKQNIFSKSTYYQCHHSGTIPSTLKTPGESLQKPSRNRLSKKFGKTCTACFHIRENDDGSVLLRGCTKHTGHGVMVRALPLSEEIRLEIANLLIKGYDEGTIINFMKKKSNPKDRRYFLQNYEIRNIAYKIERFKEEYKRRADTGEALPDLAQLIREKGNREKPVIPTSRAVLSSNPYPTVVDQHDQQGYETTVLYENAVFVNQEGAQDFDNVIIDEGQFHVPGISNEDEIVEELPVKPIRRVVFNAPPRMKTLKPQRIERKPEGSIPAKVEEISQSSKQPRGN